MQFTYIFNYILICTLPQILNVLIAHEIIEVHPHKLHVIASYMLKSTEIGLYHIVYVVRDLA